MGNIWDRPVRSEQYSIVTKRERWDTFNDNPTEESLLDFGAAWWSHRHFGDPRHFVRKRVMGNGYSPAEIRDELVSLAESGPEAIEADLPGMGVATLSELLEVIEPAQHATLNSMSRAGMEALDCPVPGNDPGEAAYRRFTEDVKEIVPEYGLRSKVEETVEGPVPENAEPIDVAQVAFVMNDKERFGFSLDDLRQ